MEWVKLIATPPYYIDPALLRAGEAAEVLFCRGLAYCGSVESRGVVDKTVLPMLCPKPGPRATALVREGLWLDQGDHYLIRSWDKWQDEHDAAAERRRKDRERKRESRRTPVDVSADSPRDTSNGGAECRALEVEEDVEKEDRPTPPAEPPRIDVEQICSTLAAAVVANGARKPTITQTWRREARLLLDKDQRPLGEVLRVVEWATQDSFWKANILSVPTLREKYDRLLIQAQQASRQRQAVGARQMPPGTHPHKAHLYEQN